MAVTSRAVFRTINLNDLVERFDAPSIVLEWGFAPSNSPAGAPFCCSTQRSHSGKFLKSSLTPTPRRGHIWEKLRGPKVMCPVAFFEVRLPRQGEFEGGGAAPHEK